MYCLYIDNLCAIYTGIFPASMQKVTDFPRENVENLNKYQVEKTSTIAVKHVSNDQFPHETNLIFDKGSCKVL